LYVIHVICNRTYIIRYIARRSNSRCRVEVIVRHIINRHSRVGISYIVVGYFMKAWNVYNDILNYIWNMYVKRIMWYALCLVTKPVYSKSLRPWPNIYIVQSNLKFSKIPIQKKNCITKRTFNIWIECKGFKNNFLSTYI